jgi:hypothetical protein
MLDPLLRPPSTLEEKCWRKWLGGGWLWQKNVINFLAISDNSKQPKKSGGRGVPQLFFTPNLNFFCELKPPTTFQNPTITPSGRKVMQGERKKEEEEKTP